MSENSRYRWVILTIGVLVVFTAVGLGRFGYTMILPAMQEGLSLTTSEAGDLAATNMLGYLLLAIACGFLASRYGPRVVILYSLAVVSASMFLTGIARSYGVALISRFLTGSGGGGVNVPIMGLMTAWFVKEKRGFAAGLTVGGSSLGLLVTGLLIPRIINSFGSSGWRISWYVLGSIAAVVFLFAVLLLRDRATDAPPAPKTSGRADIQRVLREKRIWLLSLLYVTFGFSYIIYATFFARSLISDRGLSETTAGLIWSGVGLLSITSGFIWGTVSDRFGRKSALIIVYLLQAISYGLFAVIPGTVGYGISALFFALSAFSVPAIMSAATGDMLGARLAPAGFGVLTLSFGIGQIFGPMVAGRIAEANGSFTWSFLTASGAACIGCLCALFLLPKSFDRTSQRGP